MQETIPIKINARVQMTYKWVIQQQRTINRTQTPLYSVHNGFRFCCKQQQQCNKNNNKISLSLCVVQKHFNFVNKKKIETNRNVI